jgi:glycyl-tRNA synthetase beta chain
LFVFDGAVVPFELEGIMSADVTEGHRFLGSGEVLTVTDFASYKKALADNFVILDHGERQVAILEQAKAVCAAAGLELIEDQGLLEEVAGLVEWPVPLLGDMDAKFLALPPEVIKTSMRTHQKYFAVKHTDGKMAPHFVVVANMQADDGGLEIKRGNAKVLSARLSDAVFFWDEDNRAGNFDQWLMKLKGVTFHAKLGTLYERVARIEHLAVALAHTFGVDPETAKKAARLCKADLASYMVGEFPELQGVMGGYYAKSASFGEDVAIAIAEHYKPLGPSDGLPETALGALIAVADKIDTLACFFAIDEKPTGSKDPFALRRQALGVFRIWDRFRLSIDLSKVLAAWYETLLVYAGPYGESGGRAVYVDSDYFKGSAGPRWAEGTSDIYQTYLKDFKKGLLESPVAVIATDRDYDLDLHFETVINAPVLPQALMQFRRFCDVEADFHAFFCERLKVRLKDGTGEFGAAPYDVVDAVFASDETDLKLLYDRVQLIQTLQATADDNAKYKDAVACFKRCHNVIAAESKKTDIDSAAPSEHEHMADEELALYTALKSALDKLNHVTDQGAYKPVRGLLLTAQLRPHVDAFLDHVHVNVADEAIRRHRLALLAGVVSLSQKELDMSVLN